MQIRKERGSFRLQWSTDSAAEVANLERRTARCKWITRVQTFVAEIEKRAAAKFVHAGTSEDIHACRTEAIVLGVERILINTHFADRFFRRQAIRSQPIDVNRSAFRAYRWTSQRLQRSSQRIGIVRQDVEIFALQSQRIGVVCRINIQTLFVSDRHLLSFKHDLQLDVMSSARPGIDFNCLFGNSEPFG